MNPNPRIDHLVEFQFKRGSAGPGGSRPSKDVNSICCEIRATYAKAFRRVANMRYAEHEIKQTDSVAIASANSVMKRVIETVNARFFKEITDLVEGPRGEEDRVDDDLCLRCRTIQSPFEG